MKIPKPEKEMSAEEMLERVRGAYASDRINLYCDLKKILGNEQGGELFKKLYDEGMKRVRKNFPGGKLPVGELMKRELVLDYLRLRDKKCASELAKKPEGIKRRPEIPDAPERTIKT